MRIHFRNRIVPPVFLATLIFALFNGFDYLRNKARRESAVLERLAQLSHGITVESVLETPGYASFIEQINSFDSVPNIQFLDRNLINLTVNYICNLRHFGEEKYLALVVLDVTAFEFFKFRFPYIPLLFYDAFKQKMRERGKENSLTNRLANYQLLFIFRATLIATLLRSNVSMWITQPDSIWRASLSELSLENLSPPRNDPPDIIADVIGNDETSDFKKMRDWLCGSMLFVRSTSRSLEFLAILVSQLRALVAPDSALMSSLCRDGFARCHFLPYEIASNSDWFYKKKRRFVPLFLQFDFVDIRKSKSEMFAASGFDFVDKKTGKCASEKIATKLSSFAKSPYGIFTANEYPYNWIGHIVDSLLQYFPFREQRFMRHRFLRTLETRQ